MSNYIGQNDLIRRIGEGRLAKLAGLEGSDLEELIQTVISQAETIVEGYASARCALPLPADSPAANWSLDIAEYEFYKRGAGGRIPAKVQQSYADTMNQLRDLSAGRITISGRNPRAGNSPLLAFSSRPGRIPEDF